MPQATSRGSKQAGFTLLEMSLVIVIMGFLAIALMTMFSSALQKLQYKNTISRMQAIQTALRNFRYAHNRLPCPADATIALGALNFGIEAANMGSCTGGVPAANYSVAPAVGSQDAREGMVPTKTLELPDDYAFDGWGRRFMYAVSKDMTQPGAFSVISVFDQTTRMTIINTEGTTMSTQACEVLISFGFNGHGAFPRNGGATRINASSSNANELNNCDCNNAGVFSAFDGSFVQSDVQMDSANVLDNFDDIVFFTGRDSYIWPINIIWQPYMLSAAGQGAGNPTTCYGGPPICTEFSGVKQCVCGY